MCLCLLLCVCVSVCAMNDFHCWLPVSSRAQDAVEVAVTTLCVCASNVPKSAASHCRDPKLVCPLPFSAPSAPLATRRLCELRRTHIFKYFKLLAPSPSYPTVPHTYCSSPVPIQHYPTPAPVTIPMPLLCLTHSSILSCQFQFHFSISSSPKVSLKFLQNV